MIKTVFDDLISNLKRIKPETIYSRSVSQEALDEAVQANISQLERGELDSEQSIGNYSKSTVARNEKRVTKVSTSDVIKFKDTGKFHKTIKAKVTRDGDLKITSRSKKAQFAQDYVDKNGLTGNVLGLQEDTLLEWYERFVDAEFKRNLVNRILYGA
jgi:hypothetical protein